MRIGYLGIDQYGQKYVLRTKHPRKELCEKLGRKSARKMYRDSKDGMAQHIGYIVGGLWIRVYALHEWTGKTSAHLT